MIRGLYSAATGLDAAIRNQDVISENLAHATVPGYRRRGLSFQSYVPSTDAPQSAETLPQSRSAGVSPGSLFYDFQPGEYQQTDNPLDLALQKDAFFVLQSSQGLVYSRNGAFQLNGQGELVRISGLKVMGDGGPIVIPPGNGSITVDKLGNVAAGKNSVGKLRIVRFDDPQRLIPVGSTLFSAPDDAVPRAATSSVLQGFREGSNVNVANEMVNMIVGMRHYESASRSLRALSEAVEQHTQANR